LVLLLTELGKYDEALAESQAARDIRTKLVEQYPAVPAYQIGLGLTYFNYGVVTIQSGKPAESLEWFDRAVRTLQPIHEHDPRDAIVRQTLQNCHTWRAKAYERLHKFAEAVKDWDRTVVLSPPGDRPKFRMSRATSQIRAGMVVEAVAEVAELTKIPNRNADDSYNFACVYAIASAKIADKKQEHADRAMELLQQAVKAGFTDAAHMAKDTDLDPLRDRDDFQELLDSLLKPQSIGSSKS
jgi:tetratricopeptide (TPR) repeat protein